MSTQKTDTSSKLSQRLDALNQFKIDLGLDRLQRVLTRLDLHQLNQQIITVGGTNGKGSTVTALSSLLKSQSKSFGLFTSPHIFKFNERININGRLATDAEILQVFSQIDAARDTTALSYFEYALLAALLLFRQNDVDVMLLEVGLGGRLDATNAVDADACVITTVDLDHTAWLGDTIEAIAYEKAGIMRADKPVVFGDIKTPEAIKLHANQLGSRLIQLGVDYQISLHNETFNYHHQDQSYRGLTRPSLKGDWQIKNFSSALTVLLSLGYRFSMDQVQQAIDGWHIKGRLETIQSAPLVLADVAHNRQSAQQLAHYLKTHPVKGQSCAVFSVLADKHLDSWLNEFAELFDHWFVFELSGERAMGIMELKTTLADHVGLFSQFDTGQQAYDMALQCAAAEDRVVVFGSFHVLEAVFNNHSFQS